MEGRTPKRDSARSELAGNLERGGRRRRDLRADRVEFKFVAKLTCLAVIEG
jgi:hypothetical protein